MKRIHLFEFEDFAWFPDWIRRCMVAYIQTLHRVFQTAKPLTPLVQRGLACTKDHRIIDLCSGAGGPMIEVARIIRASQERPALELVLTDLYPNQELDRSLRVHEGQWLRYEAKPIDAACVPTELTGLRTMICSLHHMRPEIAQRILQDVATKKQPFLAFELSDNSSPKWLWWTAVPIGFLLTLIMTLRIRPLTFRQLFFTYCIPIIPLCIAWDGAVSNARTYTKADLDELLKMVRSDGYQWEIATVPSSLPTPMLYLLGLPQ